MINVLAILYLNLSAPIMLYSIYRAIITKKNSLRKYLLLISALSILIGNILVFILLSK